MRSQLKLAPGFDPYKCFHACDLDSDGFFNADDLRELFKSEMQVITERDI
jgi:hypothetical protein